MEDFKNELLNFKFKVIDIDGKKILISKMYKSDTNSISYILHDCNAFSEYFGLHPVYNLNDCKPYDLKKLKINGSKSEDCTNNKIKESDFDKTEGFRLLFENEWENLEEEKDNFLLMHSSSLTIYQNFILKNKNEIHRINDDSLNIKKVDEIYFVLAKTIYNDNDLERINYMRDNIPSIFQED